MLWLGNVCDLNEDAEKVRLEDTAGPAMVRYPSATEVSHVVFASPTGGVVKVITPVEIIRSRRVRPNVKDNVESVQ